ncbi:TetR/AcrR family transcriptional regulator [Geomonas sp.]|uniref:TetR/AcrR family transcriptional regulator n=1 Tax=Geomonas sp. TaxID=2651584 RepID=UPI002B45ADBA|nr:TetR/AcrR family transcriptional regulator [Geomonas sp.]HJV36470.1 TetR/AcrR family transcriptional regulator [Geomonas sp.]
MPDNNCRAQLIAAATPLFARRGVNGVSTRELARAAGVNSSMISYHFGGKEGLYEAVLREVFSGMLEVAELAAQPLPPLQKFKRYVYQCGVCFHCGAAEEFVPRTASADPATPECPRCLNNDADSFAKLAKSEGGSTSDADSLVESANSESR